MRYDASLVGACVRMREVKVRRCALLKNLEEEIKDGVAQREGSPSSDMTVNIDIDERALKRRPL